jgi:hypothetical protein
MKQRTVPKYIFLGCAAYTFLAVIIFLYMGFLLPTFEEVGHLENGCYQTDAMIMYVKCEGVFLNSFVSLVINFFFLLYFYLPFLAISEAEISLYIIATLVWLPFCYLFAYLALNRAWEKFILLIILAPTIYAVSIINFAT